MPDLPISLDVKQKRRNEHVEPVIYALTSNSVIGEDPLLMEERFSLQESDLHELFPNRSFGGRVDAYSPVVPRSLGSDDAKSSLPIEVRCSPPQMVWKLRNRYLLGDPLCAFHSRVLFSRASGVGFPYENSGKQKVIFNSYKLSNSVKDEESGREKSCSRGNFIRFYSPSLVAIKNLFLFNCWNVF